VVDEKAIRRLRIEHLLATYRREGANRRALDKERTRLDTLSSAELAALQLKITADARGRRADDGKRNDER
jgi:hypothetical protein